jgi:uncharacterized protein YdaU (DUF1376 family)
MAKDPATLWYWNDWNGGTMTMSRQAKGAYMDLLAAQFNSGHLTETQIRTLLGQDQGLWVTVLREKFLVDGDGRYYNERLEKEIVKRKEFSERQRVNGMKGGRPKIKQNPTLNPTLNPNHNPNHNPRESLLENENESVNETKDSFFGKSENLSFSIEHCAEIASRDDRWMNANKASHEELSQFNRILEQIGEYEKNPKDYKRHFSNLKRKYPDRVRPQAKVYSIDELREMAKTATW